MNSLPAAPALSGTHVTEPGTSKIVRLLALGAVVGPVLFTLAWLVLGFISPGYTIYGTRIYPYSPVSQPVSGLGMGVTAPYMNAAMVLGAGLLTVIGVVGVFLTLRNHGRGATRVLCVLLLSLSPLGIGLCGIFTIEYPVVHLAGFVVFVLTPVISFPIAARFFRRIPEWRHFGTAMLIAVPVTLVILVLFFTTYDQNAITIGRGISGIPERVLLIEVQAWFVAMGWLAYRRSGPESLERPAVAGDRG